MKNLVIIRTCLRDDFIAWNCYQSFKNIIPDADYCFFAEQPRNCERYKWITQTGENISFRRWVGNMGGVDYALPYIEDLKEFNKTTDCFGLHTRWYENIIISDADIVLYKNPLEHEFDFGGIQDDTNKRHFSGQLQIYDGCLLEKVLNYPEYPKIVELLLSKNISIADDTLMSWVATMYTDKVFNFFGLGYWLHEKLYHLEKEAV